MDGPDRRVCLQFTWVMHVLAPFSFSHLAFSPSSSSSLSLLRGSPGFSDPVPSQFIVIVVDCLSVPTSHYKGTRHRQQQLHNPVRRFPIVCCLVPLLAAYLTPGQNPIRSPACFALPAGSTFNKAKTTCCIYPTALANTERKSSVSHTLIHTHNSPGDSW
ncbi:hypothetical protein LZ30DRAFT_64035 [Colletotrichum cereale]|nr:hypothetical protein LZ30DRAFT_64035 [Colletotrichum cereale]